MPRRLEKMEAKGRVSWRRGALYIKVALVRRGFERCARFLGAR
jgi:hypothetical protein